MTVAFNQYAQPGGTILSYGPVGDTPSYTALGRIVKSWDEIPSPMADVFETTRTDQPGRGKEFGLGDDDPGKLVCTLGQDDPELATLFGLRKQMQAWKVEFSTGATIVFNGMITGIKPSVKDKDENTWQMTIQPSGLPVFAAPDGRIIGRAPAAVAGKPRLPRKKRAKAAIAAPVDPATVAAPPADKAPEAA